jgi:ABC-type antimicrobial peptide transport system permease subunit
MATPKEKLTVSVFLAILFTSLWSASGIFDSIDPIVRARVAHQFVAEGKLVVESHGDRDHPSTFRDAEGPYPSYFGPGQSLFFLPFDVLASLLTHNFSMVSEQRKRVHSFFVSVPVFWFVLFINFFLCLKLATLLRVDRFIAYLLAFTAIFGSTFWQMAKQGQEEVQLSMLLLCSLYGFLRWKQNPTAKYVWLSAASASAALVLRLTASPIFIGIAGLYAYELFVEHRAGQRRRSGYLPIAGVFACTCFCALAVVGAYNLFKTGDPLRTGYSAAEGDFSSDVLDGIIGPIMGLDRGILWTNPWLLPFIVLAWLAWRRQSRDVKVLLIVSLFLFASSIAIYCKWSTWPGDSTYGARYQVHVVPLLALVFGIGTWTCLQSNARNRRPAIPPHSALWLVALFLFLLQFPSISFIHDLEIYQAQASGADSTSPNAIPTRAFGQIWLRYANFFSKLRRGHPVEFTVLNPSPLPAGTLENASRWNFWPWLAEKRVGARAAFYLKVLWVCLVGASVLSWGHAFRRMASESRML